MNQVVTPDTIHQSLGYWSSLIARSMEAEFNKRLSGYDITRTGWAVLGAITYDHVSTPSALADFLKIDRAAITRLLDKLEAQGLITRNRMTENRRAISLRVTPAGRTLAADLRAISNDVNAQFAAGLSPQEAEQYIATIKKMIANSTRSVGTL